MKAQQRSPSDGHGKPRGFRDVTGSPTELPEGPEAGGQIPIKRILIDQKDFDRSTKIKD